MRSRCQSRAWASFIIPRCATPSRETRVELHARRRHLCDDIAKLCPTRVQPYAQDAVDAEPGVPEEGVGGPASARPTVGAEQHCAASMGCRNIVDLQIALG